MKKVFQLIIGFALFASMNGMSQDSKQPEAKGNFSLPASQQISPLISFGQLLVDKGVVQSFIFSETYLGKESYQTEIAPYILYGIRDDLLVLLSVPFFPNGKSENSHSAGIGDMFLESEYAFYTATGSDFTDQATVVASIELPTGSSTKNPPTGMGSTSFFVGITLNRTTYDWWLFLSPGVKIPTYHAGTRFGAQILYEWGLARNIPSPHGWIFAGMLEFDGTYSFRNKVRGSTNRNSGGNVIYMTPSLWFSSEKNTFQLGVGYPIVQHLFGDQLKEYVSFDLSFSYTF